MESTKSAFKNVDLFEGAPLVSASQEVAGAPVRAFVLDGEAWNFKAPLYGVRVSWMRPELNMVKPLVKCGEAIGKVWL